MRTRLGWGLIFALPLWAWGDPPPTPVPFQTSPPPIRNSPSEAPREGSSPVLKTRRFLVALGEQLRVPGAPEKAPLPEAGQSALCRWEKKANAWWVTGLALGKHRFEWDKEVWEVLVQERALQLPADLEIRVFGDFSLSRALLARVRDFLHPRAQFKQDGAGLQASGPDLIPYQARPSFREVRAALEPRTSEVTLLSNWPEKVEADQILLDAPLEGGQQARVMVHHRNMPEQPLRWLELDVLAEETGFETAISSHLAGPSNDEIFAGHLATTRFVEAVSGPSPAAYGISLAAGRSHRVDRVLMKPGQTVSGMLWLRGLKAGQRARLRVQARTDENQQPLEMLPLSPSARTARGVFPGEIRRQLRYRCGAPYLFEDFGGPPYVQELGGNTPSPGNFGVVYRYGLEFDNPSAQWQEARLEISARGGPARACFWLDGLARSTDLLKAEPRLLKAWRLPPQGTWSAQLELFPQAGSNYPVSLILSSRPTSDQGDSAPVPTTSPSWYIP